MFDLDLLFRAAPGAVVRGDISEADLRAAITRIVEIGYAEFRAKVLSFVEPAALPLYEPVGAWEDMQMTVIERLEGLLP